MIIVEKPFLSAEEKERICVLWNNEYPQRLATNPEALDIYFNKTTNHLHFLLLDESSAIAGWAYTFDRDGERWFSIIMDREYQGLGLGRLMMEKLQEVENSLCGWVTDHHEELLANGEYYRSPLHFYEKLGFNVQPEIRFESETMSAVKIWWVK